MSTDLLSAALACIRAGVSIIPIDHTTKRPAMRLLPKDDNGKATWKPFQTAIADEATVRRWFAAGIRSFAVVCGAVSGGLLIIDLDVAAFMDGWVAAVGKLANGLPVQQTGGGGYQVLLRCPDPGGNAKLAWTQDETEETGRTIAIETRGEGGYAVVAPSLHPSGNMYKWLGAMTAADVPSVTQEHADKLLAAARALDEAPMTRDVIEAKARQSHRRRQTNHNGQASVIDTFNAAHPIEALLERHGYTKGTHGRLIRPGGKSESVSVKDGRSCHWSSNDPLSDGRGKGGCGCHDAFDVYTHLEHGGDVSKSVKAAAEALGMKQSPKAVGKAPVFEPVLVCMADVEAREIDWLWAGRIALGRITLIVGKPGEGKSFVTTDMAARVTTGTPWPDGSDCPVGSVLLVCAEDDPGDTIRPRLDAHHADVRRVHLMTAIRRVDENGKPHDLMFTLNNLPEFEIAVAQIRPVLIVIDPIGSFLGGDTDAHRDNEVRGVLAPVAMLAERYGAAVVIVAHRRKSIGGSADDLALGSRAFTGIARAVWHVSRDGDNPKRRLFLPGKNNLAPEGHGLAFSIVGEPIGAVVWEREPVTMSADDALAVEQAGDREKPGPEPEARNAAAEWLLERLSNGAVPVGDTRNPEPGTLRREAKDADIAWATVRRASETLGVRKEPCPHTRKYQWRLPKLVAQPRPMENNLSNLSNHNISGEKHDIARVDSAGCSSSSVLSNHDNGDGETGAGE